MLRPDFTKILFKRLQRGDSINLIGTPGSGCTECLQDIRTLALSEGITTVYLDMKAFKYSYEQLLKETKLQLLSGKSLQIDGPKLLGEGDKHFSVVVNSVPINGAGTFLLLDHFDNILDNRNQRLPKTFFDDLNSLKNRSGIAVCCVTEKPHLQYQYYFKDEAGKLENSLSWLDLSHLELPRLLDEEIDTFFEQHLKEHQLWEQESKNRNQYINLLRNHEAPLRLIRVIESDWDLNPSQISIDFRLKRITQEYYKDYRTRPKKPSKGFLNLIARTKDISEIIKNLRGK